MHRRVTALLAAVLLGSLVVSGWAPAGGAAPAAAKGKHKDKGLQILAADYDASAGTVTVEMRWDRRELKREGDDAGHLTVLGKTADGPVAVHDEAIALDREHRLRHVIALDAEERATLAGATAVLVAATHKHDDDGGLYDRAWYDLAPVGGATPASAARGSTRFCSGPFGPNADLSNCSIAAPDLSRMDLSGANLSYSDFQLARLADANLSGANLSHLTMPGANLYGADLSHATMTSAVLTGSNLEHANLTGVDARQVVMDHTRLEYTRITAADLTGANLTGASSEELGMWLDGTKLAGATLVSVHLANSVIDGSDLTSADLTSADLTEVLAQGVNLTGARLVQAILRTTGLKGAILVNADLTDADLSDGFLFDANLSGATGYWEATLDGAWFCNTTMPWGKVNNDNCPHPPSGASDASPLELTGKVEAHR